MFTIYVAVLSLLAAVSADLPVQVPLKGNVKAKKDECQSWWGPQLVQTNTDTTILYGACKTPGRGPVLGQYVSSKDMGKTWSEPRTAKYVAPSVYSKTSSTLIMTVSCSGGETCDNSTEEYYQVHRRAVTLPTAIDSMSAPVQMLQGNNPNCKDCIQPSQLPQLTAEQLARCQVGTVRSTDDGETWSKPIMMNISNSLGPHYAGAALNHGIQIQKGPHAGRLAMARRFDCAAVMGDHNEPQYFHSFVLFSDDDGVSWTVGELLPQGWTECQIAEMRNGSLLLTSRMWGSAFVPDPKNATSLKNKRRGFARSDDGGATWAEVWYVMDRQPEIGILQPTCAQALCSDPGTDGTIWWAHPGSNIHSRSNYTLHRSDNGGASWDLVNRVYAGGAGYSDARVLRDGGGKRVLAMAFQKTFDPTVPSIEGGGYDMGFAYYPLDSVTMSTPPTPRSTSSLEFV